MGKSKPSVMKDVALHELLDRARAHGFRAPAHKGTTSPEPARSRDQHLGLRFWVDIDSIHVAEFAECSGLTIDTEVFEYAEGGLNTYTHKLPVRTKYSNITLKRGLDEGQDLFRWYMDTVEHKTSRRTISIQVYDTHGNTVRKWDLQKAYPVKWTGPDLKADAGAVAVESVEIAHEGLIPSGDLKEVGRVKRLAKF